MVLRGNIAIESSLLGDGAMIPIPGHFYRYQCDQLDPPRVRVQTEDLPVVLVTSIPFKLYEIFWNDILVIFCKFKERCDHYAARGFKCCPVANLRDIKEEIPP